MKLKNNLVRTTNPLVYLLIVFALAPFQEGWGQPWTCDFGTSTGSYNTASGSSTSFFSSTPTGGGTYRIRCATSGNQGSGFILANPGTTLGSGSELQVNASVTASTNKFGVYDWNTPSTVAYVKCKFRTTSTGNGNLNFSLGTNAVASDNNGYSGEYNLSLTSFTIAYTSGAISSVVRRISGSNTTVTGTGLAKDSDQVIEIYANNGSGSTSYSRGSSYSLATKTWDLWVDGVRVVTNAPTAGTLAAGTNLSGFGFFAESSTSNAAWIFIDDLEYSNTLPTGTTTPTISSPTYASITTTTAILGGNITSDGGASITERGTVWSTTTGVTISNNKLAEGSTTTGIFSHTRSGLPAGSQIFFKAYAINSIGTSLTTESSFYTLSTEPTAYPASFTANAISASQIDLSFSAASTISNASGYIILQRTGSAPTGLPSDATGYSVGNSIGDGTVAAIVTSTSATAASITGLSAGTTYYFKIYPFNNNVASSTTYNYKTDAIPPGSNATTFTPASVTTTTAISSVTINSAVSGGSGLSENGNAITAKGVCWNTTANPTIANSITNNGTGTTAFTSNLTSLAAQTLYYVRAYATNSGGTGYGNELSFYTLSNEPTGQASNLVATTAGTSTQNLSWTAATFPASGASNKGYVLIRAVAPNIPSLTNSDGQAPVGDANTTIVSNAILSTDVSFQVTTLTPCTEYIYKLIPRCYNGSNASTYNYLFTSAPESAPKITACELSDAATAGGESLTISSLENDNAPLGASDGAQVWQFTIRDGGSSMNDADLLPTKITALKITKNSNNSVADWTDAIKTAALFDGSAFIATATGITDTELQFTGLTLSVPDNSSKTYTLRLSLNSDLGTLAGDNQDFVFSLTYSNVSTVADGTSSRTSNFTYIESTDIRNVINVVGTKLSFKLQPSTTSVNLPMSPSVIVGGTDINSNVDKDYSGAISLSSSGTMTGDPVVVTTSSGIATFNSLTHTVAGTLLTLTASDGGVLGSVVSNTFDISTFPANSYRSVSDGTWSGATWERFLSGSWQSSTAPSTNTSDFVYIRHNVSGGGSISPGNVVVESGATFTLGSSSTIGTSLLVLSGGTLQVNAAVTINGSFTVESGGTVNLNHDNTSGLTAFWNGTENFKSGSIFNIQNWNYSAGSGANRLIQNPSIIAQNSDGYYFGNLIISGSPSQIFVMSEGSQTINLCSGDFTSSSSGSNVAFTTGLSNVTIGGNLKVTSGQFSFGSSSTAGTFTSTILGNIELSAGTINLNQTISGTTYGIVNLLGNLITSASSTLTCSDQGCKILFKGTTTQEINIAGTLGSNVEFEIQNGNLVRLASQNLALPNSTNPLTVLNGGTLYFNGYNVTGSAAFTQNSGGHLIITSTSGIASSGATGNVQTTTRSFNTAGNFTYTGTAAQVTGTGLPLTVNNLTIDNSGGVSLTNASVTTTNDLTINTGKLFNIDAGKQVTVNGTLTNNGGAEGLIIKSDATGTGSLIHNTSGVPGTIKRYITGSTNQTQYRYHMVSVPMDPSENSLSGLFYGSYLLYFEEDSNKWEGLGAPLDNVLDETRGYLIYYVLGSDTTYSFSGAMNSGAFTPLATNLQGINDQNHGWNLVPNPYPSSIDWNASSGWTKTNIDNSVYIWDASNARYASFVSGVGTNGGSRYIQTGQGFFVHATATPTFTMNNSVRVHNGVQYFKNNEVVPNVLRLELVAGFNKRDEMVVRFNEFAGPGYDSDWDAYNLSGNYDVPDISTLLDNGVKLSINTLPFDVEDRIIPVRISNHKADQLQISATGMETFNMLPPIYLEDKVLNRIIDLTEQPVYSFSFTPGQEDRFNLIFRNITSVEEPNEIDVVVYKDNDKIRVMIPVLENRQATIMLFDALGRNLQTEKTSIAGTTNLHSPETAGTYIVRIISGNTVVSRKIVIL